MKRLNAVPWHALDGIADELAVAIDEVLAGGEAERVLDKLLRRHRDWSAEQRAVAAESVFGVGLWRRRIESHLQGAPATALQRLEVLRRDARGELPTPSLFADRHSVPDWLARLIERELGDEAEAFAATLNQPGPICLRTHLGRITREALASRLRDEGVETEAGRASGALRVTSPRPNLYGLSAWSEGLFEIQDDGSQQLGELVPARAGETVLDLCAGAGGKTLQLSAAVGSSGLVHAYDVDASRLERLLGRAQKARATNVRVHHQLPTGLRVQHVLVDAPCSELGVLRRGPDLRWRLDPSRFEQFPGVQRALLERALTHLQPGGSVTYATCTIRREENAEVAAAFASAHASLREDRALMLWPHRDGCDAFFAVRWVYEG